MSKKDVDNKSGDKKVKKLAAKVEKADKAEKKTDKKVQGTKINDGKCCRCVHRSCKVKICGCKKSAKYGKYVARKGGCNCFKYND